MTVNIVTLKNLYGAIFDSDDGVDTLMRLIRSALRLNNPTNSIIYRGGTNFFLGEDKRIYLLTNLENQPRLCRVITSHKDWLTTENVQSIPYTLRGMGSFIETGVHLSFYTGKAGCLLDKSRHVIMGVLLDNETEPHWFTEAKLMALFTPSKKLL